MWCRYTSGIPKGLSEANQEILEEVFAVVAALADPWIVMGDFNLRPKALSESRWLSMVKGVICATPLPTCNDSVYDFFVVHKSLAHAVAGDQRVDDGG